MSMVSLWRSATPETWLSPRAAWSMYDAAMFHWRESTLLTFSCHILNLKDAMCSRLAIGSALLPPQWTDPIGDIPASANLSIVFAIARLWSHCQTSFNPRTGLSRFLAILSADFEVCSEWLTLATDASPFTNGYSTRDAWVSILQCHSRLAGSTRCYLCQFRRNSK